MDISAVKESVNEGGVWFTPTFPNGTKCDFDVLIVGRNTEEFRKALHRNVVRMSSSRKKEAQEAIGSADIFVACVRNWRGLTDGGKEYPCTKENKEAMYKDAKLLWLTEQIEQYALDDSNFFSERE